MLRYKHYKLADGRDKIISRRETARILGVSISSVTSYSKAKKRWHSSEPQLLLTPVRLEAKKLGAWYSLRMVLEFAIARDAMHAKRAYITEIRANAARSRKNLKKGNSQTCQNQTKC